MNSKLKYVWKSEVCFYFVVVVVVRSEHLDKLKLGRKIKYKREIISE